MRTDRDTEFSEFVLTHRGALLRTAALMLAGDQHKAEDAVQVALTRIYLAWPRVRKDSSLAYARRCVVNAALDDHRSAFRRREQVRDQLPEPVATESGTSDPESAVLAACAGLPSGMRAAVVLRYLDGLSLAETADALGCSQGNVKSQSARGLAQLRRVLTAYAPMTTPAR